MLNKVMLEGNLVADPDTRPVGLASVTKFRIASTRSYPGPNGEKRSKTTYIDCQAWNGTGQNLARFFKKGDPILLDGRLEFDEWEKDGRRHSRNLIDIAEFHFPRAPRATRPEETRGSTPACAAAGSDITEGPPQF